MNPITANQNFFQNCSTVNVGVTLTIHNTTGNQMTITLSPANTSVLEIAGNVTVTAVFGLAAGQALRASGAGTVSVVGVA